MFQGVRNVPRCQSTILDERCPFSKERAWSHCLGAVVDALLESSHLLAHVGGTAQPERLGGPSLGLVGFAMQGPSQGNALLVSRLFKRACDCEVLATNFQPFLGFLSFAFPAQQAAGNPEKVRV